MTRQLYVSCATAGREAFYDLSGGPLTVGTDPLAVFYLAIGEQGASQFNHTGGMATVTELRVGTGARGSDLYMSGLSGSYSLSGTGQLLAESESIGLCGLGLFTHAAGANTASGTISLGTMAQGDGTCNLSGESSRVSAADLVVGDAGKGTFLHMGGTVTTSAGVVVGRSATADGYYQYDCTGNQPLTPGLIAGDAGRGVFVQDNGALNVAGGITLGHSGTGNGTYFLNQGGAEYLRPDNRPRRR